MPKGGAQAVKTALGEVGQDQVPLKGETLAEYVRRVLAHYAEQAADFRQECSGPPDLSEAVAACREPLRAPVAIITIIVVIVIIIVIITIIVIIIVIIKANKLSRT